MKILIDITPKYNKWCNTEKDFINLLGGILQNELGVCDLEGDINSIKKLNDENQH